MHSREFQTVNKVPKSPYGTILGHFRTLYPLVIIHILNKCSIKDFANYRYLSAKQALCCLCSLSLAKIHLIHPKRKVGI